MNGNDSITTATAVAPACRSYCSSCDDDERRDLGHHAAAAAMRSRVVFTHGAREGLAKPVISAGVMDWPG